MPLGCVRCVVLWLWYKLVVRRYLAFVRCLESLVANETSLLARDGCSIESGCVEFHTVSQIRIIKNLTRASAIAREFFPRMMCADL